MVDGRARAKISRKSTHSVMTNTGFGDLIIKKHGIMIHVPQNCIKVNGTPKKVVSRLLSGDGITKEIVLALQNKGCRIEVA